MFIETSRKAEKQKKTKNHLNAHKKLFYFLRVLICVVFFWKIIKKFVLLSFDWYLSVILEEKKEKKKLTLWKALVLISIFWRFLKTVLSFHCLINDLHDDLNDLETWKLLELFFLKSKTSLKFESCWTLVLVLVAFYTLFKLWKSVKVNLILFQALNLLKWQIEK